MARIRENPYVVISLHSVNSVLDFRESITGAAMREYSGFTVNMDSSRYSCFANSLVCLNCGRIGTHFKLEYQKRTECKKGYPFLSILCRPHFNLYTAADVMLTQDHIIPKCKGGTNSIDNLQTMCAPCNSKKSDALVVPLIINKPIRFYRGPAETRIRLL